MPDNLGPQVSRVLLADDTQYQLAIWSQGRPPTDAALNLMQQLAVGSVRSSVLQSMPSGWLCGETNLSASFHTNVAWSNHFKFGPNRPGEQAVAYANVAGMLIPVSGTKTGNPPGSPSIDPINVITLDPPSGTSGDSRIDFVFLEVWKARIQPNPATTNKPSASGIWKYGNVESGFSFLSDDLIDPNLGFETEQRTQVQYRIRVVKGLVGLSTNPDGFDPVTVKAQGAAASPTSYVFQNQRSNGDPGLWRAGDGTANSLGTVDGYTYAIPLCAVFRRNSVVWSGQGSPNLTGGFNRNPTAVDRSGVKTFTATPTLTADLSASALSVTISTNVGIQLPANPTTPVLIQIGDELLTYQQISGSGPFTMTLVARGANGTRAEAHKAGTPITVISGRPDGLFSDQIALTDILDLRHAVNPNGFDYDALLKSNLDKALRGQLRANWKRAGQSHGVFLSYQDAIKAGSTSLGITKLDAPDNIRMVFSDSATVQPIEFVVQPHTSDYGPGAGVNVSTSWSLGLTVNVLGRSSTYDYTAVDQDTVANQFTGQSGGDVFKIPVGQLKFGLPGGDADQVKWLNDGVQGAIRLRFDGDTGDIDSSWYSVYPTNPTWNDDLYIVLNSSFVNQLGTTASPKLLHITAHAVYGAGRGLSQRPDALHSISYLLPNTQLLVQESGIPSSDLGSRVAWAPLWSKYRNTKFNNMLPVTAEMYADNGNRSVIVTPFRNITFPNVLTIDGNAANPVPTPIAGTPTTGTTFAGNDPKILVGSTAGVVAGPPFQALVIPSGPGAGRYTIVDVVPNTSITVDRPIRASGATVVTFTIHAAQGVMPMFETDGVTPKWGGTTTDPLDLFCSQSTGYVTTDNIYVTLPRHLVPGWGELRLPIRHTDTSSFGQGLNFMSNSKTGSTHVDSDKNYVNYNSTPGGKTYASFSTVDLGTMSAAVYNQKVVYGGEPFAGIRFFTDFRGLGRQGLELPPFYGVARLFAVYEANDYKSYGSAFDPLTRIPLAGGGGATNLLRQSMSASDGPVLWVEVDEDGDSTFILNAKALDLSRSPNPISSFATGDYVIEASIFGFDRGTFANGEARLVMTRSDANSWSSVGVSAVQKTANAVDRANNINRFVAGPLAVLPGPATNSDQIVINYSRSPYQGDAWGSASSNFDAPYRQGSMLSGDAYQVVSTHLDQNALTRPNQKVLEVLASTSFATTLGTGRYSADATTNGLDFKDVAYEDPTMYPPTNSGVDPRPTYLPENFSPSDVTSIGTEYNGASTRLPLGALWRDKDFRGQVFSSTPSPLVFSNEAAVGRCTSLAVNQNEYTEVQLDTASSGVGAPGDVLVHVDGEQGNYSLLTNFRTNRGGSVFTGNGAHPGGEFSMQGSPLMTTGDHTNVLVGRAMLVRNTVTNVGASEVSAGDELMMLIITNVVRPETGMPVPGDVTIGTDGAGEGNAAADLYRIEGHPLVRNNVRVNIDPSTIALSKLSLPQTDDTIVGPGPC